jgi:hypothetical protein
MLRKAILDQVLSIGVYHFIIYLCDTHLMGHRILGLLAPQEWVQRYLECLIQYLSYQAL